MRTLVRVFSGEYDVTYKARLRDDFDAVCLEPRLILDMRGVSYVDSTFANELLRLHRCTLEEVLPRNGSPVVIQCACRGDESPLPTLPMHTTETGKTLPAWDSVTLAV
jgi:hypothetical protein